MGENVHRFTQQEFLMPESEDISPYKRGFEDGDRARARRHDLSLRDYHKRSLWHVLWWLLGSVVLLGLLVLAGIRNWDRAHHDAYLVMLALDAVSIIYQIWHGSWHDRQLHEVNQRLLHGTSHLT